MKSRHVLFAFCGCMILLFMFAILPALLPDPTINSYEDCRAAKYPEVSVFPHQCKAPDGRVFTQTGNTCFLGDFECAQGYRCLKGMCRKYP